MDIPQEEIASFQGKLDASAMVFVDTFRVVSGGTETKVLDLNLQALLSIMARHSGRGNLQVRKSNLNDTSFYMASAGSPEHGLYHNGDTSRPIVIGAEVKGIEFSLRKCLPQLLAHCGSSCIELHRLGVQHKDCVVLGIVMAGSSCQFYAVYLLTHNFPVLVALSPPLTLFGTGQDRYSISMWCLRFIRFGIATSELVARRPVGSAKVVQKKVLVKLGISNYFPKPVRCGWKSESDVDPIKSDLFSNKLLRLNHIMETYEVLRKSSASAADLILFPAGVVSVPAGDGAENRDLRVGLMAHCEEHFAQEELTHTPLILFPRLHGWKTEKPPEHLQRSYIKQLKRVRDVLDEARIAHLDQRAANIMWREKQQGGSDAQPGKVEIRLIDFEEARFFGELIPGVRVEALVRKRDWRYPFKSGDDELDQFAGKKHNAFFFKALKQWINSDIVKFDDFMVGEGAAILQEIENPDSAGEN